MKHIGHVAQWLMFAAWLLLASSDDAHTNPLLKVIGLLTDLKNDLVRDASAEAKSYKAYYQWCDDTARNFGFELKSSVAKREKLDAKIEELSANIEAADTKIDDLASSLFSANADLKNATAIRRQEKEEFEESEGELVDAVDTLGRAMNILEREMSKNPALLAQVNNDKMTGLLHAISMVIDAASLSTTDKQKLMALVQSRNDADDSDGDLGAPTAAAYKSHSTNLVDMLEDMKDKAEEELSSLRKSEAEARSNFAMLKQSMSFQMSTDSQSLDEEKSNKAASQQAKATAEGELEVTSREFKSTTSELEMTKSSCIQAAADHEASMKARDEELKVVAEATKTLESTTNGAADQTYSLLELSSTVAANLRLKSRTDLARSEVVILVRRLAREHHSAALAQLASRMAAAVRMGSLTNEDPLAKVKGLIEDLISRLKQEAQSEASEKEYCDEQLSKTKKKKTELEDQVKGLTSVMDQSAAESASLKEDVKELQAELAAISKEQSDLDQIRRDSNTEYLKAKADLQVGLDGVRRALIILREYYGQENSMLQMRQPELVTHSKSSAAEGIIGILEVIESDFALNLAKVETEEADALEAYEKITQENKESKAIKEQDVKYKTHEFKQRDKHLMELSSDHETVDAELDAVLEYYSKVKERCIAKPDTYEDRSKRREAEINGLKEALSTLENETAFLQRKRRVSNIRDPMVLG